MSPKDSLSQYSAIPNKNDNEQECLLCKVYRCERKANTYLYVGFKQDLEPLPQALIAQLGELFEVITLELTPARKLANADVIKVISEIQEKGFYLQLPPLDDATEQ